MTFSLGCESDGIPSADKMIDGNLTLVWTSSASTSEIREVQTLARWRALDLPVPPGFVITVDAYQQVLDANI